MEKQEKIEVEKLILEKGEYVMGALDEWFKKIPKEKLDRPLIAAFGQDIKPITYTPKQLYEELKKQIKEKKISKEKEGFLVEIVKKYGGMKK